MWEWNGFRRDEHSWMSYGTFEAYCLSSNRMECAFLLSSAKVLVVASGDGGVLVHVDGLGNDQINDKGLQPTKLVTYSQQIKTVLYILGVMLHWSHLMWKEAAEEGGQDAL